jgi:hypothetical protein
MKTFKRKEYIHLPMERYTARGLTTIALAVALGFLGCALRKQDVRSISPQYLEEVLTHPQPITTDTLVASADEEAHYGKTIWAPVARGFAISRTPVYHDASLVDVITALRIDPQQARFRVFNTYDPKRELRETHSLDEWVARATGPEGAPLALFSGVKSNIPYGRPAYGLILNETQVTPSSADFDRVGTFVAEPVIPGRPNATIIPEGIDYPLSRGYRQATESPLIIKGGKNIVRLGQTYRANQLALGTTKKGQVYVVASEGGQFTASTFPQALIDLYDIRTGISLDRGTDVHFTCPPIFSLDGRYDTVRLVDPLLRHQPSQRVSSLIGVYEAPPSAPEKQ